MNAPDASSVRSLTYCTNIHPGESWADVRRNVETHGLLVKRALLPDASFPLGLRISAQAAQELDSAAIQQFSAWCERHGCHVATVNGFPYGPFHGSAVKRAVYQPDWRHPDRVSYTKRLADVLAQWTPSDRATSISTVPVAFHEGFEPEHWAVVRAHVVETLVHLAELRDRGGPLVRLAFEPEPCCVLEATADAVEFFERMQLPDSLAEHAGVCLDCCHQAVEFEDPARCLAELARGGVRIVKVQVSSALCARGDEIQALTRFDEPTYLHQAVLRTGEGALLRFTDLPELARWLERREPAQECRVHFHVPVFLPHLGSVGTTRFFLEQCLPMIAPEILLEVETYSFGVLPPELRLDSVADSLTRELRWVQETLNAPHRRD